MLNNNMTQTLSHRHYCLNFETIGPLQHCVDFHQSHAADQALVNAKQGSQSSIEIRMYLKML